MRKISRRSFIKAATFTAAAAALTAYGYNTKQNKPYTR